MVINYKKAFNLAEVLLAMAILSVIIGLVIQSAKKQLPDMNKLRAKNAYVIVEKTIASMLDDETLYPNDTELADLSYVNDAFYAANNSNNENNDDEENASEDANNQFTYGGVTKFREIFKSKANILKKDLYCEYYLGINKIAKEETCFKTANGIVFGIPETDFVNTNVVKFIQYKDDRQYVRKYVPITIYPKHSETSTLDKDAFIVGVSYNGELRFITTYACDSNNSKKIQCKAQKYIESQTHKKD